MTKEKPRNLAASVRQRLMNLARTRQEDFQFVLMIVLRDFLMVPARAVAAGGLLEMVWPPSGPWQSADSESKK
jgi:hypothetical protein